MWSTRSEKVKYFMLKYFYGQMKIMFYSKNIHKNIITLLSTAISELITHKPQT